MFETKGIKVIHAIVTDECRTNRGDTEAIKEAMYRIKNECDQLIKWHAVGKDVKFHIILSVEMPEVEG